MWHVVCCTTCNVGVLLGCMGQQSHTICTHMAMLLLHQASILKPGTQTPPAVPQHTFYALLCASLPHILCVPLPLQPLLPDRCA